MDEGRYKSLQVFYFSGTGNARRVTRWILDRAERSGLPAKARNIETVSEPGEEPPIGGLIGFVYPVHGFITIWTMLKFILFFPRDTKGASVFAVTSLGGCKVGRCILPGWEGSGLYLPMLILRLKGYRWAGALPMRSTPENWTALLPGYGEAASRWMLGKCRPPLETFLGSVLAGRRDLRGRFSAVAGFALLPVSLMYLMAGKILLAKTVFSSTGCNGCGVCAVNCPVSAIKMKDGRPFWKLGCESCMRCVNYCPRKAVQAHLPFWVLMWFFLMTPLAAKVQEAFVSVAVPLSPLFGKAGGWVLYYVVVIILACVLYRFWFWVLGSKWVNRLFETTAPTLYYHRYREPDTDFKDLKEET